MILSANNISKSFLERELFKDGNFKIEAKDRIGLIGENGCGKTTIFKIICGEEASDTGSVIKASGIKIGTLNQFACKNSEKTCYQEALSVFSELISLEEEIFSVNKKLEIEQDTRLIEKAEQLRVRFEREGGLTYKSRTRSALIGLGFTENELNLSVSNLSGGQQSKIELCKLLLASPDLMLLDEPTNHLDIDAIEWLDEFIKASKSAVLIISHDRYFLDRVANKILSIEHGKIYSYNGNYSNYLGLREHREESVLNEYKNTMREVARIEGIIKQQKQFNREKNIRTAESKQKQIDRMLKDLELPASEKEKMCLSFKAKDSTGKDVLKAKNLSCKFSDKVLYENVNLDIKKGERIFIIGKNGCGKTTLLKALKNQGATLGAGVSVGYFDQQSESLDDEKTIFDFLKDSFLDKGNTEIRSALALFQFKGEDVFKKIKTLSGGERAKVTLCGLMLKNDNLLLLDEPTNHLDLSSREVLEDALCEYEGTIIAVSHDRFFINRIADSILYFDGTELKRVDGNYDSYLSVKQNLDEKTCTVQKEMGAGGLAYKQKKEEQARQRRLKTAFNKCEEQIACLEEEQKEIELALLNPDITSNYEKTTELALKLDKIKKDLDIKLLEWEELSLEILE